MSCSMVTLNADCDTTQNLVLVDRQQTIITINGK